MREAATAMLPRGSVNFVLRVVRSLLGPARFDVLMGRGHRHAGYRLLRGRGIEIGALHAPALLSKACTVSYVDAISTQEAIALFPEIDAKRLVQVDLVADLDTAGLSAIADETYDFVVMNHVIEHVANPIRVISELFRVVRRGGHVVLSAPDMRFSFDRVRKLTSHEHLVFEYEAEVTTVTDDHYEEFVLAVKPTVADADIPQEIREARARREHAHVWNSSTFESFMRVAIQTAAIDATQVVRSDGDLNRLEHFSVWLRA